MFNTPVLLLIFNRPDTTKRVFEKIKELKPSQLFVAADGPRGDKEGEEELCLQTREIIKDIDWECELKTLFRAENLGCGKGPSSAITWFFSHVEQGIILEDDCLPNHSFFTFVDNMLKKYKNNEQIMLVSGSNYLLGLLDIKDSYYFSQVPTTWGWGTWRRAWNHMNFEMKDYNKKVKKFPKIASLWHQHWESILNGTGVSDAWDFQWYFSIYEQNGLCIHPKYNLVQNIGFDYNNATHTFLPPWWYKFVINKELKNIRHTKEITVNKNADKLTKQRFSNEMPTFLQRLKLKLMYFTG